MKLKTQTPLARFKTCIFILLSFALIGTAGAQSCCDGVAVPAGYKCCTPAEKASAQQTYQDEMAAAHSWGADHLAYINDAFISDKAELDQWLADCLATLGDQTTQKIADCHEKWKITADMNELTVAYYAAMDISCVNGELIIAGVEEQTFRATYGVELANLYLNRDVDRAAVDNEVESQPSHSEAKKLKG